MIKILNGSACIILILSVLIVIWGVKISGVINLGGGLIVIGICSTISIIEFALVNILENQERLFKEIREQNSLIYRLNDKTNRE